MSHNHLLTCNCGSTALRIQEQDYTDFEAWEKYQCQQCGAQGTLTMYNDDTTDWYTGCLAQGWEAPYTPP
jgi:hypothetical protein